MEATTADLVAYIHELLAVLGDIITDEAEDPCWFDHHGYCQAHSWFHTQPSCPYARGRELLARTLVDEQGPHP